MGTGAAGIFSSVEATEPVMEAIDDIPFVADSDWLHFIVIAAVFSAVFRVLSLGLDHLFGRDPVDVLAALLDRSGMLPDLTQYYDRRIAGVRTDEQDQLEYRIRRVAPGDLDIFSQIGREAFARTAFALPLDMFKERNQSFYRANPLALALIEARIDGQYTPVGATVITPLNKLGEMAYIQPNGLSDAKVRGIHLAAMGEWSNAVIIFEMGLLRSVRGRLGNSPLSMAKIVIDHLAEVLNDVHKGNPSMRTIRVYAQTERPTSGVTRLLQGLGFVESGFMTGDGYPLRVLELPLAELRHDDGTPANTGVSALLARLRSLQRLSRTRE